jgi:putative hydrolase of the HAD superfamily
MARALDCDPKALSGMLDRTFAVRARGGDGRLEIRRLAWRMGLRPTADQVSEALRMRHGAVRASLRLRPDTIRTLVRLRHAGLRIGLVSDCTEDLPEILAATPIAALLDAAVFSAHLGVVKPHPAMYLTVCHRLGVEPADCLYVGDGGGHELSGAEAVGMTAVRLNAHDLSGHLTFAPDRDWTGPAIETLDQVLDLVQWGRTRPRPATVGGGFSQRSGDPIPASASGVILGPWRGHPSR